MRRALLVGINDYPKVPLNGCVRDATMLANSLDTNGDGSPNFAVRLITSEQQKVDHVTLINAVYELFAAEADVALFYFSGHGNLTQTGGLLVSQNIEQGIVGLSMNDLLARAAEAHGRIKSIIVILDCCHSGALGEAPGLIAENSSVLPKGFVVLSASHKNGYAIETEGKGLFTSILIDGLQGWAADILGRVTPAALYTLVDQTLDAWDQRPIFRANVQAFVSLRQVNPKIAPEILRRLPLWFPEETSVYPLDPQHEPDRLNLPEHLRDLPRDELKEAAFAALQACNRLGLVVPVDSEHMYYAAINSSGCRLTALGAHYRKLAELKRI